MLQSHASHDHTHHRIHRWTSATMPPLLRIAAVIILASTMLPQVAAWSNAGHHVIARLAFAKLSQKEQTQIIQILEQHPRYTEDLVSQKPIVGELEQQHWLFGRAAYWPDVARRQPEYHRSTWHYQLDATLTLGENLELPKRPGPLPEDADLSTKDLHITQAIELCRRTLRDQKAPPQDKAIAICWLGHLVGDAHQPCHAGSLYVQAVFPEGDRGANSIPTRQRKNLHALWDALLGDDYSATAVRRRFTEISAEYSTAVEHNPAANELDPLVWLDESQQNARRHVYAEEILNAVEAARRSGNTKLEVVDLTEDYLKNAGRVAQERAALAGHRLARLLQHDLRH